MDKFLLQLDLNLLKALYFLLQEKNVTQAADRMFITQSAMSKTLRRLREAFDDELLVRTNSGLVPTPLAEQLSVQLEAIFNQLQSLSPIEFDPAGARNVLRIAVPETFAMGMVPKLLMHLKQMAPTIDIDLFHLPDDYLERLRAGAIDFVIYVQDDYPEEIICHKMYSTSPRIWCRGNHPLAKKKDLTLEDICNYPKIGFHSPNISQHELRELAKALDWADVSRDMLMTTSHLMVALYLLVNTDALMVSPNDLHEFSTLNIVSHSIGHIPLFGSLRTVDVALLQHQRTIDSPFHNWVIEQALALLAEN
jgi:DNA-binding transcriptional LysR family regulator